MPRSQPKPEHLPPGAMGPGPGPCTEAAICPGAGTPPCMGGCIRGGAPFTCIPPCPGESVELSAALSPGRQAPAGRAGAGSARLCHTWDVHHEGSYYGLWLGRRGALWVELGVWPWPRPRPWPGPWPWHRLLVAWDQRRHAGLAMQDFLGAEGEWSCLLPTLGDRLPPISYQPQTGRQGTNQRDLRVDDPHDHLGLQQGIGQLGILEQHVPGFLGAVLDTQLRRHGGSELQQGATGAAGAQQKRRKLRSCSECPLVLTFICFMSSNICSGGRLATARLMDSGASSGLTGSP